MPTFVIGVPFSFIVFSASGNVDVRVNRYTGRWGSGIHSGLSFRVVDANNFFFAYTTDTGGSPNSKTVRVGYYLN